MDIRTGRIYQPDDERLKKLMDEHPEVVREMRIPPTKKQMSRRPPKIGRNEPCPCGSGKKFKKCCLDERAELTRRMRQDTRNLKVIDINETLGALIERKKSDSRIIKL
jgi:hypothetical protein